MIPNLNHDILIETALYLAFEAKLNSKAIWRAIEDSSLAALHLLNVKQICQLEWATNQLKPKHTTGRFNTMLMQHALE